jgi:hypothetical protein
MGRQPAKTLPLIPLARGSVLLPGIIQRIPVTANRPDIPALLSHVYETVASKTGGKPTKIDTVPIACVPAGSPFVGPGGQLLINNGEEPDISQIEEVNPAEAKQSDLFGFGVAAKIIGIDGRDSGEFALRVEGTHRVKVETITHDRKYFEAKVTYYNDEGRMNVPISALCAPCLMAKHADLSQWTHQTRSCKSSLRHSNKDQESSSPSCASPHYFLGRKTPRPCHPQSRDVSMSSSQGGKSKMLDLWPTSWQTS